MRKRALTCLYIVGFGSFLLFIYNYYTNNIIPSEVVSKYISFRYNTDYNDVEKNYILLNQMLDETFLNYLKVHKLNGIYLNNYKNNLLKCNITGCNISNIKKRNDITVVNAKVTTLLEDGKKNEVQKSDIELEFYLKQVAWNKYTINYIKYMSTNIRYLHDSSNHLY